MHYSLSFLFILFLCSVVASSGQPEPHSQQTVSRDTIYRFSSQILQSLNTTANKVYSKAAHEFSFIGEYANALLYGDMGRPPFGGISATDSATFRRLTQQAARKYILDRARREQVIIINEAHHIPMHRVFVQSLLSGLYQAGYRYFAAETLGYQDKDLNKRKYPVLHSGFYSVEPQYGQTIRLALQLGFTVVPYEAAQFTSSKQRELDQAHNLEKIFLQDPKARVVILAGYDHIREDSLGGDWEKAMAGRLLEFTHIDPFTINQEVMTERSRPELENPYYKMATITEPAVFVSGNGEPFAGPVNTHYYDVRVFHPRTQYIEGRPDWLLKAGYRMVALDKARRSHIEYPCLVFAYHEQEDIQTAVPADVIELKDNQEVKSLALPKGKYKIVIRTTQKVYPPYAVSVP